MRIYERDNKKYISVTSILDLLTPFDGKSFEVWCKKNNLNSKLLLDNSIVLGEKVCRWVWDISEGLMSLSEPCIDKLEENLLKGAEKFCKDYEILSLEQEVYNEELSYAGRYDALIDFEGEPCLVDFKTFGAWKDKPYKRDSKKISNARRQLSLYSEALQEEGGIYPAHNMAIVVFKNDGDYEFERLQYDPNIVLWVQDNQKKIQELLTH